MSLQKISHLFDGLRSSNDGRLSALKASVRKFISTSNIDKKLTQENYKAFVDTVIIGNGVTLTKSDSEMIFGQLQRSMEGEESDTFVSLWDYWLRERSDKISALLVVDVQNDFISGSLSLKCCPAGEDGFDVVNVINNILKQNQFKHVVYTQDWHPLDHCSFIEHVHKYPLHKSSSKSAKEAKVFDTVVYSEPVVIEQKLWPTHCVQNSWGAELHKDLKPPSNEDIVCKKGFRPNSDSYSAFWDSGHVRQTDLFKLLLKRGVSDVYVCGLAFDICVKYTARDAVHHGFGTYVIKDACRGTSHEGELQTKDEFKKDGIKLIDSSNLVC